MLRPDVWDVLSERAEPFEGLAANADVAATERTRSFGVPFGRALSGDPVVVSVDMRASRGPHDVDFPSSSEVRDCVAQSAAPSGRQLDRFPELADAGRPVCLLAPNKLAHPLLAPEFTAAARAPGEKRSNAKEHASMLDNRAAAMGP